MKHLNNNYLYNCHIILSFILFTFCIRFYLLSDINHFYNFSALNAMALFTGCILRKKIHAICIILLSVWISDLFINKIQVGNWIISYEGSFWQYICYGLITLFGSFLRNVNSTRSLVTFSLFSSFLFFIISNFGVLYGGLLYNFDFSGLVKCYLAGIPFFKNTLISDLFFNLFFFNIMKFTLHKSSNYLIKSI